MLTELDCKDKFKLKVELEVELCKSVEILVTFDCFLAPGVVGMSEFA